MRNYLSNDIACNIHLLNRLDLFALRLAFIDQYNLLLFFFTFLLAIITIVQSRPIIILDGISILNIDYYVVNRLLCNFVSIKLSAFQICLSFFEFLFKKSLLNFSSPPNIGLNDKSISTKY